MFVTPYSIHPPLLNSSPKRLLFDENRSVRVVFPTKFDASHATHHREEEEEGDDRHHHHHREKEEEEEYCENDENDWIFCDSFLCHLFDPVVVLVFGFGEGLCRNDDDEIPVPRRLLGPIEVRGTGVCKRPRVYPIEVETGLRDDCARISSLWRFVRVGKYERRVRGESRYEQSDDFNDDGIDEHEG